MNLNLTCIQIKINVETQLMTTRLLRGGVVSWSTTLIYNPEVRLKSQFGLKGSGGTLDMQIYILKQLKALVCLSFALRDRTGAVIIKVAKLHSEKDLSDTFTQMSAIHSTTW